MLLGRRYETTRVPTLSFTRSYRNHLRNFIDTVSKRTCILNYYAFNTERQNLYASMKSRQSVFYYISIILYRFNTLKFGHGPRNVSLTRNVNDIPRNSLKFSVTYFTVKDIKLKRSL